MQVGEDGIQPLALGAVPELPLLLTTDDVVVLSHLDMDMGRDIDIPVFRHVGFAGGYGIGEPLSLEVLGESGGGQHRSPFRNVGTASVLGGFAAPNHPPCPWISRICPKGHLSHFSPRPNCP